MNKSTVLAALVISLGAGGTAFAADQSAKEMKDKTQVVPSREALPAKPDLDSLDANTQRMHDRDRDSAQTGADRGAAGPSGAPIAPKLRDWSKIDKNGDGLIQPEEMNAWNEKYTGRQVTQ